MSASDDRKPSVLLLHNRYREPGGEERAVAAIEELLRTRGHDVELLERSSAELAGWVGRARAGAAMLRGGLDPREIAAAVDRHGAEIVHVHNLNPLFGTRVLAAARAAGARVVMHLHNYRLFCAIAIAYRDQDVCTRCRGPNTSSGLLLRCRGSTVEAAVYATGLALQQRRILRLVDRFVVPSRAAAEQLAHFGMPDSLMDVVHNFIPDSDFAEESGAGEGEHALFAGRLVEEKGVEDAILAARRAGVPLVVAGIGPELERLKSVADGADVRFTGRLAPAELAELRRRAAFAVVPSRWHEPCPYAALEAMAGGLPVLASAVGGLPEIVGEEQGTLPPRSVAAWASAMGELWADRRGRERKGKAALEHARSRFGADRFYTRLAAVYQLAFLR
jgi:glycosyltransferase involved in cell wall biosynthesis